MPQWGILACCSSIRQVRLYHQRPVGGWCLTLVGHDASSASQGWSLLPSTVIIVLVLVNSTVSPADTSSISMRPGSAALLPVSNASTGLLRLLVGASVHCVRSDTEKYRVWPLPRARHFQCVTYISGIRINTVLTNSRNTKWSCSFIASYLQRLSCCSVASLTTSVTFNC